MKDMFCIYENTVYNFQLYKKTPNFVPIKKLLSIQGNLNRLSLTEAGANQHPCFDKRSNQYPCFDKRSNLHPCLDKAGATCIPVLTKRSNLHLPFGGDREGAEVSGRTSLTGKLVPSPGEGQDGLPFGKIRMGCHLGRSGWIQSQDGP